MAALAGLRCHAFMEHEIMSINFITDNFQSPVGEIIVAFEGKALIALDFGDCEERFHKLLKKRYPSYSLSPRKNPFNIRDILENYFTGKQALPDDFSLNPGGTTFQKQVWRALCKVPHGQFLSYSQLAQNIKNPRAVRAVGRANGLNPIALFIPCHRIIARNGQLTGYAGGLARKKWLLDHEENSTRK